MQTVPGERRLLVEVISSPDRSDMGEDEISIDSVVTHFVTDAPAP